MTQDLESLLRLVEDSPDNYLLFNGNFPGLWTMKDWEVAQNLVVPLSEGGASIIANTSSEVKRLQEVSKAGSLSDVEERLLVQYIRSLANLTEGEN